MEVGQFKIIAIIQARLGSSRLPNKVLLPLSSDNNNTILSQIFHQIDKVKEVNKIVLATSTSKINNKLHNYSQKFKIECYRGDEEDVLSRFSEILEDTDFDYVLRFTADNPIIDIEKLKEFINYVLINELEYSYSKNLPIGCNFEMVRASSITEANIKTKKPYDREHVTPYIKRKSLQKEFYNFESNTLFNNLRLTVDYPSDYSFIYLLYNMTSGEDFNLKNIEKIINENKWLLDINKDNFQKKEYKNIADEIKDLIPILEEREMKRLEKKFKNEE